MLEISTISQATKEKIKKMSTQQLKYMTSYIRSLKNPAFKGIADNCANNISEQERQNIVGIVDGTADEDLLKLLTFAANVNK